MKNILQKLYYYSPYIPIIGVFIAKYHNEQNGENFNLITYDFNYNEIWRFIYYQIITIILISITLTLFLIL